MKDWMIDSTAMLIMISLFVAFVIFFSLSYNSSDSHAAYQICQGEVYFGNMEPGYFKCCWTAYIDHEAVKSCETMRVPE